MFRRILLIAGSLLMLSAAPAAAQSYGDILGKGQRTPNVVANGPGAGGRVRAANGGEQANSSGGLARTGSNEAVPMAEAAIVLIGGGSLLLLVARRRRAQRRDATA